MIDMNKKIISFASSNTEKISEVKKLLGEMGIEVWPIETELFELRSEDQDKVAVGKAKTAYSIIKKSVIAEDTGVYFEAYTNFPGTFPSYMFKALGYGGLLKLLEGKNRKAHFKTIVAFYDGDELKTFVGICKGKIAEKPDSLQFLNPKLPYEAIFIPDGSDKLLSRYSKEEKNLISHRGKAIRAFGRWYLRTK
jgi:XTP/dITP diphosphohydrolase